MKTTADILNKHIYADPIKTVIEQLASHAQSAQAKASNASTPFEVMLPNVMFPAFSIRDFGVGYNIEEMMRVFSSHSVSADSLDGHGDMEAKAALFYTPVFSVSSFHQNEHHLCEVSVDESTFKSVPKKFETFDVKDDHKPTGVSIVFPVKPSDFDRFRSAALEILPKFNAEVYEFGNKIDLGKGAANVYSLT